jgi:hypothetical protein
MRRPTVSALALVACVSTPQAAVIPKTGVYEATLDTPPAARALPPGCELVHRSKRVSLTEMEMRGQKDPFRAQRAPAGAGANVLLVLSKQVISRHDPECPGASPITDCPPSSGAWFDVVFEQYRCSSEALQQLSRSRPSSRTAF